MLPARAAVARAASGPRRADALRAAPAAPPAAPLAGGLSATKVDSFADPDGDQKAEPGDTVTYTVTVTNNGPDAANVQFTDTVDPNTALVPGSVATQPVAAGDSYGALGNVRISPDATAGLLANDRDPDTGGNTGLSVSAIGGDTSAPFSATTANGGTVTANSTDGSFSYDPPAGFEGTDSFTYTVSDGTSSDTATATFNVSGMVWFVDNSAATNGDGRLTSPFNTLAPLNGAGGSGDPDDPSDVIFVHQGSGNYAGGIALENAQRLVGQGTSLDAALAAFGINVPAHSDARPAAVGNPMLDNSAGNVITLAAGNTVMYVNAGATAAGSAAVFGGAVGGTTVISHVGAAAVGSAGGISLANVTGPVTVTGGSVVCNSSGAAVAVGGGSAPVSFVSNTVSQNGGHVVDVHGRTGGAVTFDAASTVTGTNGTADAVTALSNANSAVTFAGPVHLNTNAAGARGVVADSAGNFTLNMTNAANTVSSTGGAAVDLENLAVSLAFATTFSTDSNGRGLRVDNVTGSASFGNTAVNNSANTGVLLTNNAASVTFADLDIAPATGARGLHATDNAGTITSSSGTIATKNQAAVEVAGTSSAARTPLGLTLTSVSATAAGGANPPNGIVLTNTNGPGSAAGFVVTGDSANDATGSAFSGGSIGNTLGSDGTTAGVGVYLSNADEVTLRRMRLSDNSNFAVRGSNVSNFNLEYSTVNGVNGTTSSSPFSEAAVAFDELTGSCSVKNSVVQGGVRDNVRVVNTAGVLDRLTFDNFTEGPMDAGNVNGNDGVFIQARNNAVAKVSVLNSALTSARGDILQLDLTDAATGELIFKGNTVNNTHPNVGTGGGGITLSGGGSPTAAPTLAYEIGGPGAGEGNSFRGARGDALLVVLQIGHGSAVGRIRNNVFGVPTIDRSGSREASDIDIRTVGRAAQTVLVDGNQIFQYANHGILLQAGDISVAGTTATVGDINATVTNNTISNFAASASTQAGVHINLGTDPGDNYQMCADLLNNSAASAGDESNVFGRDFVLRQRQDTTMKLPGYAGAKDDDAAVISYIQGRNVGSESVYSENTVGADPDNGGGFVPGVCAQPAGLAMLSAPASGNGSAELAASGNAHALSGAGVEAGFSSAAELAAAQSKLRRGLANSENGQVLAAATVAGETRAEATRYAPAAAPAAAFSGNTFTVNIGTLKSGDSVTITFQATVETPFDGAQPQVSNQGTVTADGGVSVLTDDPSEPGASDPTVTPLLLPPSARVNDATVAEPASGAANMLFTVALSHPYTHSVTVNYDTADNGSAVAGDDYTASSGSVSFAAGQTVQTVSVPVNADGTAGEGSETFLVNLSNPSNATIGDGQATGTITDETIPSPVIISELRTSGPAGAGDDFVELLNTTDADVTVGAGGWTLAASGAGCSDTPAVVASIPAGTVIPARGNYLLTGSAYSLGAYSAGDAALSSDIGGDSNVGLFAAGDLASIGSANRLDAVGFGANAAGNCDLLREGNNLPAVAGASGTSEYSFVRKVSKGLTQDTTDNAADFVLVSTAGGQVGGSASTLGAPGPESSSGPRGPVPCSAPSGTAHFGRDLVDPSAGVGGSPNVARGSGVVPNGSMGTIEFRRTFKNNTAATVTALRFRVVDLSTKPAAAGAADLRGLSSGDTGGVKGTTVETPPAQAAGGGVNSTFAVNLGTGLAPGASVSLRFLFGVEQPGDYNVAFVLESAPGSGKDIWKLGGNTESGGHTDGGCNKPPIANAGLDQTAECVDGHATVTLDGSGSSDPDNDTPLAYEWKEGATVLGTSQTLSVTLATGSHTVTLKVTDPSGDSSQDSAVVNVTDTQAPQVTAPADVTANTGPGATSCEANVASLGTATAHDDCEGDGLPVTATRSDNQPLGAPYPVGTTVVTYSATDGAGHKGTDTQSVTVVDDTKPTVTAPPDRTAANDYGSCSASVDPGTATASDNCGVQSVVGKRSDNQGLNDPYPVGTTTITWTATDIHGNTATATQTVTVQDTQKPSVLAAVAVMLMGPPFNHALINVGLSATVTDNCSVGGPAQVSVYSDEDDGPAPHSPDATDIGLGTLKLRRERDGAGNGRVYLIVVKGTDGSGNTAVSCQTVKVPLSSSAADTSSVNAQAAAAATFCANNNGAPPAGYFQVGP